MGGAPILLSKSEERADSIQCELCDLLYLSKTNM